MKKIIIEGGEKLSGIIEIGGAKNAVLPLIASGIMVSEGTLVLKNVPRVLDVITMVELLRYLGMEIEYYEDIIKINNSKLTRFAPQSDFVRAMRASVLVMGPMLGRFGRVVTPLPGGCAIGERPINEHLNVFEAMGAKVNISNSLVEIRGEKLKGTDFTFRVSTVTGTENAIMAAVLADGETILRNCAREPEVVELSKVLNKMGAKIEGAGTDRIRIKGVASLTGISHKVLPDRIEAGTYIISSVLAGEKVTVKNIISEHITSLLQKLRDAGAQLSLNNDSITIIGCRQLNGVDIVTEAYPGFPTDLQAQFMALMCFANGKSIIRETIFENRFQHVNELKKMGADISLNGNTAVVKGGNQIKGAVVRATDLRASASLIIAGLGAEGFTEIEGLDHLDRGYEKIEDKLLRVGARIKRVDV